jgi:hypothetical protein
MAVVVLSALALLGLAVSASGPLSAGSSGPAVTRDLRPVVSCVDLRGVDLVGGEAPAVVTGAVVVAGSGGVREYCDVRGYVSPQVQFEVALPTSGWNGDFYQTGGSARDGVVPFGSCADALGLGFVVAAQNGGHVGTDALWGRSDQQLRVDWGYRSSHVTAVVAKELIRVFYGRAQRYSIMQGCSTGGREVESEVARYPNDFDGAIAGDPAYPARLGGIENAWLGQKGLDAAGRPVMSDAKLRLLHAAVLRACDRVDGLLDGTIEDPRDCAFNPATLACPRYTRDTAVCLTPVELVSVQAFYSGPVDEHGQSLYPYLPPYGSELGWAAAALQGAALADSGLKNLNLPIGSPTPTSYRDWQFTDANIQRLVPMAQIYDPVPPYGHADLRAFHQHGGKMLIYQGWEDAGANPGAAIDYYTEAANQSGGPQHTRDWLRLFMVPGMGHCGGGDGPSTFDTLTPMTNWLRHNTAPERIIANNPPTTLNHPGRTRPLYPYPQTAHYTGLGNIDNATNFTPTNPPTTHQDDLHWLWDPAPARR